MPDLTTSNNLKDFQLSGDVKAKSSLEWGKKIISIVDSYCRSGYFASRNERFAKNRASASGNMDMSVFKDMLDMNGKPAYTNISWKAIKIVNTIISRLVGRWMNTKEKPLIKAVDPVSIKQKQQQKDMAEFILDNKAFLDSIQQQSGVPMVSKDQFVPEDKDHLDVWASYEQRLPEEILYEEKISEVLYKEGWGYNGANRRKHKWDAGSVGLVCMYTYSDKDGKIHVDYVKPENSIYSYSENDDFKGNSWRGQYSQITLSEIRDEYPEISEKDLFEKYAPLAKEWASNINLRYNDSWGTSFSRPYDDWNIDIVCFEIKSLDNDNYQMKVTKTGNLIVERGSKTSLTGNTESVKKTCWNIYEAVYCKNNPDLVLKWGLKANPVSPQDEKYIYEKDFSYSFYMYQNQKMRNLAIPEKIEEPVEGMILARLKIQKLVADMRSAGLLIDISGISSINLGTAEGFLTPIEVQRVYDQTGNYYYNSATDEGGRTERPISDLPNAGSVAQLQELQNIYNFNLGVLRDELGNTAIEEQSLKPRVSAENVQTAQEMSENAIDFLNDSCISVLEDATKKIACLLHNSVAFGAAEYREMSNETDVKDRVFDITIEFAPTEQEVGLFMQQVYAFIQTNPAFVLYVNPFKLKEIATENLKLAGIYFRMSQSRAIKGEQDKTAQQSQMNAQAQTQSAMQKAQADQQNMQMEIQMKDEAETKRSQERQREIAMTGYFGILQKGLPLPDKLAMFEKELIDNILLPVFMDNANLQAQAAQTPHPMAGQQDPNAQQQPDPSQMQQQPQGMPQQQ